jgi:HEAT repeat protein
LLGVQSPSSEVRIAAADTLAKIGDTAMVDAERALISLLSDPVAPVRYSAIAALGVLGCKSAVPNIIEFLQDPQYMIRISAAESLGYLGDPAALPHLLKVLTDTSRIVRVFAACSIGLLATSANTSEVREAIRNAERVETDLDVRKELLLASYRLGDLDAKYRLRELFFGQPGISKENVIQVLNGLLFFVEYAPPPHLKQDRKFFAEMVREISNYPAPYDLGQAEVEHILRLLAG